MICSNSTPHYAFFLYLYNFMYCIFYNNCLCFVSYRIAVSDTTEQHQKLIKEDNNASTEHQDDHVSDQSGVPEADEAPLSSKTSEEQQARCSTTEKQSVGSQSAGVRVGRPNKLGQYAKLKEQEESTTKDVMEYQDDLSDADYTPSQSALIVLCLPQLG